MGWYTKKGAWWWKPKSWYKKSRNYLYQDLFTPNVKVNVEWLRTPCPRCGYKSLVYNGERRVKRLKCVMKGCGYEASVKAMQNE